MTSAANNPFRTSRIHALPYLWPVGESLETLTRCWESHQRNGALTGSHGNGKSTLLQEWTDRLRQAGWTVRTWTLTEEYPTLPRPLEPMNGSPREVAVLDGSEQLTRWAWHRWLRATHGCARIITNHQAARLPTLLLLRTDAERLERLLRLLLNNDLSGLPDSPAALLCRHRGDVRQIFRTLYEQWT